MEGERPPCRQKIWVIRVSNRGEGGERGWGGTATHLVLDEGGEGEEVEEVGEETPDIGVAVFAQTLVVEAVYLGDLSGLVIATEDGDAVAVSELHGY